MPDQERNTNRRRPPTVIQTLIFDRDRFTGREAKRWAARNDFKVTRPDVTESSYRIRQRPPGDFKPRSFRTIELTGGVKAVVGHLHGLRKVNPTITVTEHPAGIRHTKATIRKMAEEASRAAQTYPIRHLATEITKNVPSKDGRGELLAIYQWVRNNIRYRHDPTAIPPNEPVEWLQAPERTLEERAGDCDCIATLIAALALSLGRPARFITVGPTRQMQEHIATQVNTGERWITLDPVLEPKQQTIARRTDMGAFGKVPPGVARYWSATSGNALDGVVDELEARALWPTVPAFPPSPQDPDMPNAGLPGSPRPVYRSARAPGFHPLDGPVDELEARALWPTVPAFPPSPQDPDMPGARLPGSPRPVYRSARAPGFHPLDGPVDELEARALWPTVPAFPPSPDELSESNKLEALAEPDRADSFYRGRNAPGHMGQVEPRNIAATNLYERHAGRFTKALTDYLERTSAPVPRFNIESVPRPRLETPGGESSAALPPTAPAAMPTNTPTSSRSNGTVSYSRIRQIIRQELKPLKPRKAMFQAYDPRIGKYRVYGFEGIRPTVSFSLGAVPAGKIYDAKYVQQLINDLGVARVATDGEWGPSSRDGLKATAKHFGVRYYGSTNRYEDPPGSGKWKSYGRGKVMTRPADMISNLEKKRTPATARPAIAASRATARAGTAPTRTTAPTTGLSVRSGLVSPLRLTTAARRTVSATAAPTRRVPIVKPPTVPTITMPRPPTAKPAPPAPTRRTREEIESIVRRAVPAATSAAREVAAIVEEYIPESLPVTAPYTPAPEGPPPVSAAPVVAEPFPPPVGAPEPTGPSISPQMVSPLQLRPELREAYAATLPSEAYEPRPGMQLEPRQIAVTERRIPGVPTARKNGSVWPWLAAIYLMQLRRRRAR